MYVLDFLKGPANQSDGDGDRVSFEYRLLCSGELYNAKVETSDWRKSDVACYLCGSPFTLLAVRNPLRHFPQELVLRFNAKRVTEQGGMALISFIPDEDIARDVAALLSVFLRRLVTVAGKTRELHPNIKGSSMDALLDRPLPLVNSLNAVHWQAKPLGITWYGEDRPEITDHNPLPCGVDPHEVKESLSGLPDVACAQSFVLSARLYALGLMQMEHDISLSFHSLISAVETIASAALKGYRPSEEDIASKKHSVATLAIKRFGLDSTAARELAIEAAKDISWTAKRFFKFLVDNCGEDVWTEDDVFRIPPLYVPRRDQFEDALKQIYTARGKLTHGGHAFPNSAAFGIHPLVPAKMMLELHPTKPGFPPLVWFERVVNSALRGFAKRSLAGGRQTAGDT